MNTFARLHNTAARTLGLRMDHLYPSAHRMRAL